jgi:hypothetical protein
LRKQPDSNVTGEDINKLLGSHTGTNLSGEVSNSLRGALEGGLHSLFIVMAVFAVLSLIISWGLRKGVPSVEDATSSLKKA